MSIPLAIKNNLVGLVNLGKREFETPFKQADLRFLYILAEQVALGIENAGLYRKLEAKVEERTNNLKEKTEKLERMNKLFVDRELRMRELKEEIKELKRKMQELEGES